MDYFQVESDFVLTIILSGFCFLHSTEGENEAQRDPGFAWVYIAQLVGGGMRTQIQRVRAESQHYFTPAGHPLWEATLSLRD